MKKIFFDFLTGFNFFVVSLSGQDITDANALFAALASNSTLIDLEFVFLQLLLYILTFDV